MKVTLSEICNGNKVEGSGDNADRRAAIVAALRDLADNLAAAGCATSAAECDALADRIEAHE